MLVDSENTSANVGKGRYDSEVAVSVCESANASGTADPSGANSLDYRALYFEAAGHRNSLLIEVKSLKSHLTLLNQECAQFSGACAKASETLNVRQEELDQLAKRHALTLARLDRFERSVWGRLQRLADRLVMVFSGPGQAGSRARESFPIRDHRALETQ